MPRMKIFNAIEEETFESPPLFNSLERSKHFAIPAGLTELIADFRTPTNQACFLLQFGYFKARRRFFGKQFRPSDLEFVAARIGFSLNAIQPSAYDKQTAARHQQLILDFFGYRRFDADAKTEMSGEIAALVSAHLRPKLILLEIIPLLARRKIALPSYNQLANLIVAAIKRRQQALSKIIETRLTAEQRLLLDALLEKEAAAVDVPEPAQIHRYRLTLLKKSSQSTRPAKIKANNADLRELQALYCDLEPIIAALNLSPAGIRYYANSVLKAEIFQVSRRAAADRYLHLLAFITHQTFKLQDALIETLLQCVQTALNSAQREHKERYYEERIQRQQTLGEIVAGLEQSVLQTLTTIQGIVADANLADQEKLRLIQAALTEQGPQRELVETQVRQLKREATTAEHDADFYVQLADRSLKLQSRVAEIVRQTKFDAISSAPALLAAIKHYQQQDGEVEKNAPQEFLLPGERIALTDSAGKFQVSLYKALLYLKIADALKAGTLNLAYSHKYRSLDDYLITPADWGKNRGEYLQRTELEGLSDCQTTLHELKLRLNRQYLQTNEHVQQGENALLKFRPDGTFHVTTPKEEETENLSLLGFFPERKYISLLEVLSTVNQATGFLDEFEHWQHKYQRPKPPEKVFFAGLMGYGCEIGQRKLAQISRQINESELENTINWFFSLQNLHGANDRILSVLDQLELPNLYRREPDKLHTSSDGQKFEVAVDSLNARHSFKYFGQHKGVSVYSFIDERHLLFHSTVISAAEREAAYVIDGLLHNDVVKSDIHSTDTHGYAEIVFGVTFLLGFSFAPRIKHLHQQRLYSFEKRKVYEAAGWQVLPDAYIDTELIAAHWDDILRFSATIKLKHTTASQLFKRLNSYSRQHALYRALKEFGKIPKTLFILKYLDEPVFRQAIEKQLNKIESSQKFAKAISFGHNQEFIQGEKDEQEIAEACRRLIKNAIICWNYLYLSQRLSEAESAERRTEILEAIRNGSVVTWQHINLHGEYDFSDEKLRDTVGLEVSKILTSQPAKQREAKNKGNLFPYLPFPEML